MPPAAAVQKNVLQSIPQLVQPSALKSHTTTGVEVGKLVEYAINDQVIVHFLANDFFHQNHHGGLPHHSTATALIQLLRAKSLLQRFSWIRVLPMIF